MNLKSICAPVMDKFPEVYHYSMSDAYYKATFPDFKHPRLGEGCWEILFAKSFDRSSIDVSISFLDMDGERFEEDEPENNVTEVKPQANELYKTVKTLLEGKIIHTS